MTAPTINPYESWTRERKVTDLTNALLRGHAHLLAGASFLAVVDGALATACGFGDGDWARLAAATGRRTPSHATIAGVLARLEGMLPTVAADKETTP